MSLVFYHVVTERPMKVGQEIFFDDEHHNGVYERVNQFNDVVKDIYNNPKKYENMKLEHHLKVALRELALEEVREKSYSNYPSRLSSLYVSKTLQDAEKWFDMFIEWGRPTFAIVKVEVDGRYYEGDAWNCFEGTIDREKNLCLAQNYWKYSVNRENKEPIIEIIVDGKIRVMEIVKENIIQNVK